MTGALCPGLCGQALPADECGGCWPDRTAPFDTVLDHLEAAWMGSADLPVEQRPDGLSYVLFKVGELLEAERPGLVDRLLASLPDEVDES